MANSAKRKILFGGSAPKPDQPVCNEAHLERKGTRAECIQIIILRSVVLSLDNGKDLYQYGIMYD